MIDAPEPAASAPGRPHRQSPTIPVKDDHYLPARQRGRNRRLDLSGKDDPRKARLFALRDAEKQKEDRLEADHRPTCWFPHRRH